MGMVISLVLRSRSPLVPTLSLLPSALNNDSWPDIVATATGTITFLAAAEN